MTKIDFDNLGAIPTEPSRTITDPRDLFSALPEKDAKFNYLRGPQDQVLPAWNSRRKERDIVIKMNTGGGKTVVGLLIARSLLNEGIFPVAYFVPDDFLVDQVQKEARRLGIDVASSPDEAGFQQGKSVLVATSAKLFNGLSVFGVDGNIFKGPKHQLGGIIIDDAHACVARADQAFRLRIDSSESAYSGLLEIFRDDIYQQSPTTLLDLLDKKYGALQEVPFWAWQDNQDRILDILHPLSTEDQYKFVWPLVADCLPLCTAVFTNEAVEIQAPILPIDVLTGFQEASRRIYLTATLADDSVLVRHFGADPSSVANPICPASAGDIGDRMILVPQNLCPRSTDEDVREYVARLASKQNVVVIVPSRRRAEWWAEAADLTLDRENINLGIEQLRENSNLGLVVLINRYDGIDLPGDACRILVIDGLPEAWNGIERLEEGQLRGSTAMLAKQIQRLEQGMGRATRSNEDHCVVLLMGTQLTDRLNSPSAMSLFSPASRAQLRISEQVTAAAGANDARDLDDLTGIVNQCLERDRGWIRFSRGRLAEIRYDAPTIGAEASAERRAFDAARRGELETAKEQQKLAIASLNGRDERRRALLTQRLAAYIHASDKAEAQSLQRRAIANNTRLIRPLAGVAYTRIASETATQGREATTWLLDRYSSGNSLIVGINALLQDLNWDPKRTKQFEGAIADLALHIGLKSQQPDEEYGQGPDNLWALPGGNFLVIEAKSGADPTHPVKKDDAKQLSNSMDWFHGRYPNSTATPVLVHPDSRFSAPAAIPVGCRVIDTIHLGKLRRELSRLAEHLGTNDAYRDHARVTQLLNQSELNVNVHPDRHTFLSRFTTEAYKRS